MIHDDDCRDCSGFEKTGFVVLRLKNRKRAKNKSRNESVNAVISMFWKMPRFCFHEKYKRMTALADK